VLECFWLNLWDASDAEAWDYLGFLIDEVEYVGHKLADAPKK